MGLVRSNNECRGRLSGRSDGGVILLPSSSLIAVVVAYVLFYFFRGYI
jgi:hypothetical protein